VMLRRVRIDGHAADRIGRGLVPMLMRGMFAHGPPFALR
jgi:hypothetical protein